MRVPGAGYAGGEGAGRVAFSGPSAVQGRAKPLHDRRPLVNLLQAEHIRFPGINFLG
jgi:hypothetical protein